MKCAWLTSRPDIVADIKAREARVADFKAQPEGPRAAWPTSRPATCVADFNACQLCGRLQGLPAAWPTSRPATCVADFKARQLCGRLQGPPAAWPNSRPARCVADFKARQCGRLQGPRAAWPTSRPASGVADFKARQLCGRLQGPRTWPASRHANVADIGRRLHVCRQDVCYHGGPTFCAGSRSLFADLFILLKRCI